MASLFNVADADISSGANISHVKVQHRFSKSYAVTGTVAAATTYLRIVRGATGALLQMKAAITETIATGADRTVTLDLKKSTGAGAFASVLSSTLVFNNASTLRLAVAVAGFSDSTLQAGDILQLTVAVAGAAGNQALGLIVDVDLYETPT